MYRGTTLSVLAKRIAEATARQQDYIVPADKVRLSDDARTLRVAMDGEGTQFFQVNENCHRQIAEKHNVPWRHYDRLRRDHTDILCQEVNRFLVEKKDGQTRRHMLRTMDATARAFLSDRYRRIDNWMVAEACLPALQEHLLDDSTITGEVTESKMYLKAIFMDRKVKVPGDVATVGLCIGTSEIGQGSFFVEPLVYKLGCSNGMIVRDLSFRRVHVGGKIGGPADDAFRFFRDETVQADDKVLMMKMADAVRGMLSEQVFGQIIEKINLSAEQKITGDVPEVVEKLSKRVGLLDEERAGVLRHLIEGGDLSHWGLVNAVTRTAHDEAVVDNYDRATELEATGGAVLTLSRRELGSILAATA